MRPKLQRHQLVASIRAHLERDDYPRLQMLLLVGLTGAVGFLVSYTLLQLGFTVMWSRYLLALVVAYGVFLGLLWLWLRSRPDASLDFPSYGEAGSSPCGDSAGSDFSGGGGSGGGGGASGNFDSAQGLPIESANDSLGESISAVGEVASGADELVIPLALIAGIGFLLLSSLWVVYSAPVLFAELLVDGVLAASLYRRLRGLESRHWLQTALQHTWWPFVLTGFLLVLSGWAMQAYAPEAHTLGQVLSHTKPIP